MSSGVPMDVEFCQDIINAVRAGVGVEICRAIDESQAETRAMVSQMTDEEFANWIIGEE